jgi:NDP-sugar pyrophosphorylase family protein
MGTYDFFKKIKNYISDFPFFKVNSDVANNLSYKHAKSHVKTLCILSTQKGKHVDMSMCYFCIAHNTKYSV